MFWRKQEKVKDATIMETSVVEPKVYEKPLVCLFDLKDSVTDTLTKAGFSCNKATLGSRVRVPNTSRNSEHFLRLNHSWPQNLHEYDVVVLDMSNEPEIEFKDESFKDVTGKAVHALLSRYPETIFNPRPFSMQRLSVEIEELFAATAIVIVFMSETTSVHYEIVSIDRHGPEITGEETFSSLPFPLHFPGTKHKVGVRAKLPPDQSKLSPLLAKYTGDLKYEVTFTHPTTWHEGNRINDPNFVPLILNDNDEIISFAQAINKESFIFVFPQIENKTQLLLELFNNYLPDIFPTLFPYHGQFGWLKSDEYLLPHEGELHAKKRQIEEKYKLDTAAVVGEIEENKERFRFLHEILYESGDALVKAAEQYLRWLGFGAITNVDETNPAIKEEDLQVEIDEGLLVIEVKGIGGTSTDNDCAQITKIRFRRAEERNRFDVFGLYLVNHQRYLPPLNRQNPPFTENQINDATLAKRGLLTTYELFNAYFLVEEGVITKEDIRSQLLSYGLITFTPRNIVSIGVPGEYFKSCSVAILVLNDSQITKGMTLLSLKNGKYEKHQVLSLMVNDTEVETAKDGEVGVQVNKKLRRGAELFIQILV